MQQKMFFYNRKRVKWLSKTKHMCNNQRLIMQMAVTLFTWKLVISLILAQLIKKPFFFFFSFSWVMPLADTLKSSTNICFLCFIKCNPLSHEIRSNQEGKVKKQAIAESHPNYRCSDVTMLLQFAGFRKKTQKYSVQYVVY